MQRIDHPPFIGAKAAILIGDDLLITLRDDRPDIPYPNLWDLPGGGREHDETPEQTLFREVREEVGLAIDPARIVWKRAFPSHTGGPSVGWFFVIRLESAAAGDIVFGEEGQGWALEPPATFLARRDAVPFLQDRLSVWMAQSLQELPSRPSGTIYKGHDQRDWQNEL